MFKERYQMSLSQLLEAALAMKQDEEAIYDGYRRVTYQELDREAGQLASS